MLIMCPWEELSFSIRTVGFVHVLGGRYIHVHVHIPVHIHVHIRVGGAHLVFDLYIYAWKGGSFLMS